MLARTINPILSRLGVFRSSSALTSPVLPRATLRSLTTAHLAPRYFQSEHGEPVVYKLQGEPMHHHIYVVGGFGVVCGLLSFLAYNQQQLQKDMGERMAQLKVDLVREMGEHKVDVLRAMGELKVDFVREMGEMKVDLFRETGEMKVLLMQQGMTRLEKPVSTRIAVDESRSQLSPPST